MLKNWMNLAGGHVRLPLLVMLLCPLIGCNSGPSLIEIKGKVNVDGNPTEGVGLLFFERESQAIVASAKTGPGGEFTVMTNDRPGMPEGSYIVAASWPDPNFKAPPTSFGASPEPAPDLFKGKYIKTKSEIVLEVNSSTADPVFELKLK
jgi:hypothetical protein